MISSPTILRMIAESGNVEAMSPLRRKRGTGDIYDVSSAEPLTEAQDGTVGPAANAKMGCDS